MASCLVVTEGTYTLAAPAASTARLSDGDRREFSVLSNWSTPSSSMTLWNKVAGARVPVCVVDRPTGWVALVEPTDADLAAGYRVLWGGHQNVVTGQDLADMVTDGAISVTDACASTAVDAEVEGTVLVDDLGNELVTDTGEQLISVDLGATITLDDGS